MTEYISVGKTNPLVKQGKCKNCGVPLYGYKFERRYVCGDCEGSKGDYARPIQDYVAKVPELDDERKEILLSNQIDDLKRQVAYWKEKANAS
jgi:hypothetical protein